MKTIKQERFKKVVKKEYDSRLLKIVIVLLAFAGMDFIDYKLHSYFFAEFCLVISLLFLMGLISTFKKEVYWIKE